jgi:hypothetical protein
VRRALGGGPGIDAEGRPAPRPSALRWLMVWLLLAAVYFVVRLAVRWLLRDAGAADFPVVDLGGLDGRELAIVPAAQTLALALLAELRRATKS